MARAGPSRSQRATQPSQTQTQRNGRTQRSQRTQRHQDEDEEEEEEEGEEGEDDDENGHAEDDLLKKAHALVRLALFNEQKRTPLKRDDISKKVLGTKRGAFNHVFSTAQGILRDTFAMELVELPTRAAAQDLAAGKEAEKEKEKNKKGTQANGDANGHAEKQSVTGLKKKKAAAPGSKTYILRSTLDPVIIEHAALTDESILEEEAADAPDDDSDDETGTRTYGSILAWNSSDELGAIGILYVVLAIILVNGKVLSEMDLRTTLRRLRLPPNSNVALSAHSTHRTMPLDTYLNHLVRQGYLDRTRIGSSGRSSGKRSRPTQTQTQGGNDDGETTWEWRWGPRAGAEVGEVAIARFVAEFMAERGAAGAADGSDDEEEGGQEGRRKRKKRAEEAQRRLTALTKGIEKAAGGELADVI
ncbi:MAGE-domain-containing protein [Dentipellis sp. KUC8613]|nr:MAGE-domain-containing protein [Dentipellis sp. KUC8613]